MARPPDPQLQAQRRAHLCDAAYRLLAEQPAGSVTLSQVAQAAGVSKGQLTYYFKSKDELLAAAIERYLERERGAVFAAAVGEGSVRERLRALVEAALPERAALRVEARFQLNALAYAQEQPALWERLREAYRAQRELGEALLAQAQEEGELIPLPPGAFLFVQALLDGLSFQLVLDPELDPDQLRAQLLFALEGLLAAE